MNILNTTINEYKFVSFINKGGFGSVYKVQKDGIFYAIKIFQEEYVLDEFKKHGNESNRLRREIDIIKSISHDRLVRYIDDFTYQGETGKSYFLVMEFIDGDSIKEILNKRTKIDEQEAIRLFLQILEGLNYLHNYRGEADDVGIIHRDLKPQNIIINKNREIKIVDFGISKVIDFTSLTSTGEILGTGPYMSPEQITDSKNIDKRSDLYAAGVVLYEMLTGKYPYDFQFQPELIDKIKNEPPIPPRKRIFAISNKIENIILKLLEKDPYKRFSKIEDIVFEINSANNKEITRTYDLSPRFILRLYNDGGYLKEYTVENNDTIHVEFPANLENNQLNLKKIIQENNSIKIIVDPVTVRLAYGTYKNVKGIANLPYAPSGHDVITPTYLENYKVQRDYVKKVIDKEVQLEADILLSPFHYINNSSVGYDPNRNITKEWFDLDCKLAKESIDYRNDNYSGKDILIGICIKADVLKDKKAKIYLLNTLSLFEGDGFFIYADTIDCKTDGITLYHYVDFLMKLQNYTHKPVIAGRINAGLGFGLLSVGITGFTSGAARFESFYEDLYKESSPSYNLYTRYFFPELLSTISIERKNPIKFESIIKTIGKCNCFYCASKLTIPEIILDKNTHLHFLKVVHNEINEIKPLSKTEKIDRYLKKIENAIGNYNKLGNVFKTDEYSFLNKWKDVFSTIQKEDKKNV